MTSGFRLRFVAMCILLIAVLPLALGQGVHAWWIGGHKIFTLGAAAKLPDDVPAFFREAAADIADAAAEPDDWKVNLTPHLKASEHPEHYLDLEYLEGQPIPEQRYDMLKYYYTKGIDPNKGGLLPYAIQDGYERLLLAFRDYRTRPDSKAVRERIVVYAGILAHYCQDATMPLHMTKEYDGKPDARGVIQQKGIHARIDAYPEKNGFTPEMVNKDLVAEPVASIWPLLTKTIATTFGHVGRCYELDAAGAFEQQPQQGKEFILERSRAATKLTMDIWYSAWKNSAQEAPAGK
ncbi:MAG: hypothetical protein NTW87_10300 [Planctomycetota bacterium]|nr:hypothetical protein [Planctomycetota bacterium]